MPSGGGLGSSSDPQGSMESRGIESEAARGSQVILLREASVARNLEEATLK